MIVVMFLGGHLFSISILLLITTDILLMMLQHIIRKFKDYTNNNTHALSKIQYKHSYQSKLSFPQWSRDLRWYLDLPSSATHSVFLPTSANTLQRFCIFS